MRVGLRSDLLDGMPEVTLGMLAGDAHHGETTTATEHSGGVGAQTLDARCIQLRANGQRHECNGGMRPTCRS